MRSQRGDFKQRICLPRRETLYVRFVRGGDGERVTEAIHVEETGDIEAAHTEIHMDAQSLENEGNWAMSRVSKEEFIAPGAG